LVPGKRKVIDDYSQKLRDVYIRVLFRDLGGQLSTRETPDVQAIKHSLLEITRKVVGPDVVKDVIIRSIFVR